MCVLIVSYKEEGSLYFRGDLEASSPEELHIKWCETGEDVINHVAYLEAKGEDWDSKFVHYFIYPDEKCPWKEKDANGKTVPEPNCLKLSEVDLTFDYRTDMPGGIPQHFVEPILAKRREFLENKKRAMEEEKRRKEAAEAEKKRRQEAEQVQRDEAEYERLKTKLGK